LIVNNEDKKAFLFSFNLQPSPKTRDGVMVNKLAIEKARP